MGKIDLNSELGELDIKQSAKQVHEAAKREPAKKAPASQTAAGSSAEHNDLLNELAQAANQAGAKDQQRKQEKKQEKAKAKKVKDTSKLTAIIAVALIVIAAVVFFGDFGKGKGKDTPSHKFQPSAELGAANEWQQQAGASAAGNSIPSAPQAPQQPAGFENNPM